MKNNGLRILGVVSVNLLIFEVLSIAAVYAIGVVSPNRRLDLFVEQQLKDIEDAHVQEFLTGTYDEDLGWIPPKGESRVETNVAGIQWTATYDDLGARQSCRESSPVLMASYGDSFAHGSEVDDDQTWQCVLERHFGQRVLNFGVGAYGVDQALLRMKEHWTEGLVAPITILAVHDDDLNRVVNQYRPFVYASTGGKLAFKPSYQLINDEIRFLPNPLTPEIRSRSEVSALAISVAATDFWESRRLRVPPPGFPFSWQLLKVGHRVFAGGLKRPDEIWESPEGRQIMLYLVRDFVDSAHKIGTQPVLVLLPSVSEWDSGRVDASYRRFLTDDLLPESLNLITVDLSQIEFEEEAFNILPFRGHASPYGNSIIAKSIVDALQLRD